MQHSTTALVVSLSCAVAAALIFVMPARVESASGQAPDFTHTGEDDWLNSRPLSLAALRGKVVLVEFWTFDCINCRRSIPWIKATQARLAGKDFVIVAVHTPELPQEKQRSNVIEAVDRLGITYPVMLDLDYSYWNALNNRYWPAFYLIDKEGALREVAVGELHVGQRRALAFEKTIAELLAAKSSK
jgi:thiol-disulfide isomerase/thioredoxin